LVGKSSIKIISIYFLKGSVDFGYFVQALIIYR